MSETISTDNEPFVQTAATNWLPVLLRVLVALAVLPAAVLKFVDYSGQAALFAEYGIPAPEITVLLVGAIQIPAALMILFGAGGRLGALVLVPIMVTAMATAGVEASNVAVLVGCLVILVLGAGNYTVWEPEAAQFGRLTG